MSFEPDIFVCDILEHFISTEEIPVPVVMYVENYKPPTTPGLYITVAHGAQTQIGANSWFDTGTREDVNQIMVAQEFLINLSSVDRSAITRKEEVVASIVSQYSVQKQELNACRLNWKGQVLDLSFIEESRAMKRFQITCVLIYQKEFRKTADYLEHFQEVSQEVS
jgi:hypothetical protein